MNLNFIQEMKSMTFGNKKDVMIATSEEPNWKSKNSPSVVFDTL